MVVGECVESKTGMPCLFTISSSMISSMSFDIEGCNGASGSSSISISVLSPVDVELYIANASDINVLSPVDRSCVPISMLLCLWTSLKLKSESRLLPIGLLTV